MTSRKEFLKQVGLLALASNVGLPSSVPFDGERQLVDPVDYVNPFIGTQGHGHTYPGATVPFGMVQLSPDTDTIGWDWCSGYHYSDNSIMGFSHTHVSGTGSSDLADILFMPRVGEIKTEAGPKENPETGYRSRFSHENEKARAGFYSVHLDDGNIDVELTATERCGFHKYTFPKSDRSHVIIDLSHVMRQRQGKVLWSHAAVLDNKTIVGYHVSKGWVRNQYTYFAARFSRPMDAYTLAKDGEIISGRKVGAGQNVLAIPQFKTKEGEEILAKVGISSVSTDNAILNLETEIPGWDFQQVRSQASQKWNDELGKIQVEDKRTEKLVSFYTALYHSYLAPTMWSDVNGEFRGGDQSIHKAEDYTRYTVFSLWDTYRAAHPLYTIVQPQRVGDMINSMLDHYENSAHNILPMWSLAGEETWTMIGYHAVPVIVDAYFKGIQGFDEDKAYEAILSTATHSDEELSNYMNRGYGLSYFINDGYVPIDKTLDAASKTLEYSYDDWCVAQIAREKGTKEEYQTFKKRSQNYKNVYDRKTDFMRARNSDGSWKTPFDPFLAKVKGDYTEANAWQYTWHVQHDVEGLIDLMEGKDNFRQKLDKLFVVENDGQSHENNNTTGRLGQYAHGNEPCHHIAYLFNYVGQPWKTQEKVHQIMTSLYTSQLDGLPGNDDCGQMSAWYVLSAMGFYPVNPAGGVYMIGTPLLEKATINTESGKRFEIVAKDVSDENKYIQQATLNGKSHNVPWITHSDIMKGGTLVYQMGNEPNKGWGNNLNDIPPKIDPHRI